MALVTLGIVEAIHISCLQRGNVCGGSCPIIRRKSFTTRAYNKRFPYHWNVSGTQVFAVRSSWTSTTVVLGSGETFGAERPYTSFLQQNLNPYMCRNFGELISLGTRGKEGPRDRAQLWSIARSLRVVCMRRLRHSGRRTQALELPFIRANRS